MRITEAELENNKKQINEASDILAQLFTWLIDDATEQKLTLEPKTSPYGVKRPKASIPYTRRIKLPEMSLI